MAEGLRIVSLVPAATEIVFYLGLGEFLVGRSHECDYPPEVQRLPVCTRPRIQAEASSAEIDRQVRELLAAGESLYELAIEQLKELRPTHIITQAQCDVCAVNYNQVCQTVHQHFHDQVRVISLSPMNLAGVIADVEQVAEGLGCPEIGKQRAQKLKNSLAQIARQVPRDVTPPKLLCLEWFDPLMTAGNWVPELVKLAGAVDPLGFPGEHSRRLEWRELLEPDPDYIVLMPCGFSLQRSIQEASLLTRHPLWQQLSAAQHGQIYAVDGHHYFNRPGPRLVDSLAILCEILHPQIFAPSHQGTGWLQLETHWQHQTHVLSPI